MIYPFSLTISLLSISLITFLFFDDLINVAHYDLIDLILLILAALGTTIGLITIGLGLKYIEASAAAPISNLEVAFAFIADLFLFHYHFYATDFLGAGIIFGSLTVHIASQ